MVGQSASCISLNFSTLKNCRDGGVGACKAGFQERKTLEDPPAALFESTTESQKTPSDSRFLIWC